MKKQPTHRKYLGPLDNDLEKSLDKRMNPKGDNMIPHSVDMKGYCEKCNRYLGDKGHPPIHRHTFKGRSECMVCGTSKGDNMKYKTCKSDCKDHVHIVTLSKPKPEGK